MPNCAVCKKPITSVKMLQDVVNKKKVYHFKCDPARSVKNVDSILKITKKIRKKLIKERGNIDSDCNIASIQLRDELVKNGFDAEIVQGTFDTDYDYDWRSADWTSSPETEFESESAMMEAMSAPLHYWVVVDNLIVDITGSQFNDRLIKTVMPDISIIKERENKRYNVIRRKWDFIETPDWEAERDEDGYLLT